MKANFKSILSLILIIGVVLVLSTLLAGRVNNDKFLYSDLLDLFEADLVRDFVVDDNGKITLNAYVVTKNEDGTLSLVLNDKGEPKTESFTYNFSYELQIKKIIAVIEANESSPDGTNLVEYDFKYSNSAFWQALVPYLVVGAFTVILFIFMFRRAGDGGMGKMASFGKSTAKMILGDKNNVKFADVAGADEEKAELEEIVQFLKDPEKFIKLGARMPRGVLLVGPPGTGKTLLAKAVAGEAGVPFFSISGSDFLEMYVGVGASRVRDLFDNARKAPASIIFIDEIDAVGRHRGAGLGGGHDEREQTLNQLLVEMDGFSGNEGVIVIAATNRPDILDPALLRPGRFDRQVTVNYPDINGREQILNVHAKGKPFEKDVDLAQVAKTTIGFTGADLANLLNEAALLAARRGKALIGMNDIEDAIMKIVVGTQKKSMRMSEKERLNTAYHEAGHAITAYRLPKVDPVRQISIIPSGRALGYTLTVPEEDRQSVYKEELLQRIIMTLGGRAAERIIFGDYTGGAAGDIKSATGTAHRMVTELGMSEKLGPVLLGEDSGEVFLGRNFSSTPNYSEKTAALIDEEVQNIINTCYAQAEEILRTDIEKLHFIAKYLVAHETVDSEQFALIMTKDDVTEEDVLAIVSEKQKRSEQENEEKRQREDERAKKQAERRANAQSHFGPEGYPVGGYQDDNTPKNDNNEIKH